MCHAGSLMDFFLNSVKGLNKSYDLGFVYLHACKSWRHHSLTFFDNKAIALYHKGFSFNFPLDRNHACVVKSFMMLLIIEFLWRDWLYPKSCVISYFIKNNDIRRTTPKPMNSGVKANLNCLVKSCRKYLFDQQVPILTDCVLIWNATM